MEVRLINNTGIEKECPTGFSWTTLFFGFFVPLFRGDFIGMLIQILGSVFTIGIFWLIWPFLYNNNYINRLLEKGFIPYSEKDKSILRSNGISVNKSYESEQETEKNHEEVCKSHDSSAHKAQTVTVVDETVIPIDFSDKIFLLWPVALESGSLKILTGSDDLETISCTFSFQNVQQREILYTQWQLIYFDILRKPIESGNPIIIRHERKIEPREILTLKISEGLPAGTKSFIPYLNAVLYGDQAIEEFSGKEDFISLNKKERVDDIPHFNALAIEQYQQLFNLDKIPQFIYSKTQEEIWTCAFCGVRNDGINVRCKLCNSTIEENSYCVKEKIEKFLLDYKEERDRLEEERLHKLEEENKAKIKEEERNLAKKVEQERIRKNKEKRRDRWLSVGILSFLVLVGVVFTLWIYVLKPLSDYRDATGLLESGSYLQAFDTFQLLGDYKDARTMSFESYMKYIETDAAESIRIKGYQWLLENGYPKEIVFSSFSRVLAGTPSFDERLKGLRWLEKMEYEESAEYLYQLAKDMVKAGRLYDGYTIFASLDDYKDASEQSLKTYAEYLEINAGKGFSIEGFQRLLENGYPNEKVFDSFRRVLAGVSSLDDRLNGLRWLEKMGYEETSEDLYKLANEMIQEGRLIDGYEILHSLGDYKDAKERMIAIIPTVVFDSNGGSPAETIAHIEWGSRIARPATPTNDSYIFDGWFKDQEMFNKWDFQRDKVETDMILYAKWRVPEVGSIGPAGGIIFYDKGIYSNGWRYLEAAPVRYEYSKKVWGGYGKEVEDTNTNIGSGASNTEKIVSIFGDSEPYSAKVDYGAKLCHSLEVIKDGEVYDDWFLPSKDELNQMYQFLKINDLGDFSDGPLLEFFQF